MINCIRGFAKWLLGLVLVEVDPDDQGIFQINEDGTVDTLLGPEEVAGFMDDAQIGIDEDVEPFTHCTDCKHFEDRSGIGCPCGSCFEHSLFEAKEEEICLNSRFYRAKRKNQ